MNISGEGNLLKENLLDVDTPTEDDIATGNASSVINLINNKWADIDTLNSVKATIRHNDDTNVTSVIDSIIEDDYNHIGQLETALKTLDDNAEEIEAGINDGEANLGESLIVESKDDDFLRDLCELEDDIDFYGMRDDLDFTFHNYEEHKDEWEEMINKSTANDIIDRLESDLEDLDEDDELVDRIKAMIPRVKDYFNRMNESMSDRDVANMVNDLAIDEYEAISGYNSAIDKAKDNGFDDVANALDDIQGEEHTHIGQLKEISKIFDPNTENEDKGELEGEEQMKESLKKMDETFDFDGAVDYLYDNVSTQDIVDWICDHDELCQDFTTHFNDDNIDRIAVEVSKEDILDWVSNHKQALKDITYYFGRYIDESFDYDDEVEYTFNATFAGYIGCDEEITIYATDKDEAEDDAVYEARDLLSVKEVVKTDEDEYDVTINFAGYEDCDETYTVYEDNENEAISSALEEAYMELNVELISIDGEDVDEIDDEDVDYSELFEGKSLNEKTTMNPDFEAKSRELDKRAMELYNQHKDSDDFIKEFSEDELAILSALCRLSKENPFGRAYDDEIFDAIESCEEPDDIRRKSLQYFVDNFNIYMPYEMEAKLKANGNYDAYVQEFKEYIINSVGKDLDWTNSEKNRLKAKYLGESMEKPTKINEAYDDSVSVGEIRKFLKKCVKDAEKGDFFGDYLVLGYNLALYAGWESGYGEDEDGYIRDKGAPEYVLSAKIADMEDDDYEFAYEPIVKDSGDVWDTDMALTDDSDAEWYYEQYQSMAEAFDNGEIEIRGMEYEEDDEDDEDDEDELEFNGSYPIVYDDTTQQNAFEIACDCLYFGEGSKEFKQWCKEQGISELDTKKIWHKAFWWMAEERLDEPFNESKKLSENVIDDIEYEYRRNLYNDYFDGIDLNTVCTYFFPELTNNDIYVATNSYDIEVLYTEDGDTAVRGRLEDIIRYSEEYLEYELSGDYLMLDESCTNRGRKMHNRKVNEGISDIENKSLYNKVRNAAYNVLNNVYDGYAQDGENTFDGSQADEVPKEYIRKLESKDWLDKSFKIKNGKNFDACFVDCCFARAPKNDKYVSIMYDSILGWATDYMSGGALGFIVDGLYDELHNVLCPDAPKKYYEEFYDRVEARAELLYEYKLEDNLIDILTKSVWNFATHYEYLGSKKKTNESKKMSEGAMGKKYTKVDYSKDLINLINEYELDKDIMIQELLSYLSDEDIKGIYDANLSTIEDDEELFTESKKMGGKLTLSEDYNTLVDEKTTVVVNPVMGQAIEDTKKFRKNREDVKKELINRFKGSKSKKMKEQVSKRHRKMIKESFDTEDVRFIGDGEDEIGEVWSSWDSRDTLITIMKDDGTKVRMLAGDLINDYYLYDEDHNLIHEPTMYEALNFVDPKHTVAIYTDTKSTRNYNYEYVDVVIDGKKGSGKDRWINRPWYKYRFANALYGAIVDATGDKEVARKCIDETSSISGAEQFLRNADIQGL